MSTPSPPPAPVAADASTPHVPRTYRHPTALPPPPPRPAALIALEVATGVAAMASGVSLVLGRSGLDPELLDPLPLQRWLLPGVGLVAFVGMPMLTAAQALWQRQPDGDRLSFGAGALLCGWTGVQVAVMAPRSGLQPGMLGVGCLVMGLALRERQRRRADRTRT